MIFFSISTHDNHYFRLCTLRVGRKLLPWTFNSVNYFLDLIIVASVPRLKMLELRQKCFRKVMWPLFKGQKLKFHVITTNRATYSICFPSNSSRRYWFRKLCDTLLNLQYKNSSLFYEYYVKLYRTVSHVNF